MERKIYGEIEHGIIDYPFSIISWLKIARHEGIPCSYVLKEFMKNGLKKFRNHTEECSVLPLLLLHKIEATIAPRCNMELK